MEIAVQVLKEIREYREIGTVEELKALKEIDEDLRLQYCYEDLSSSENRGYMQGYSKAIDEMQDNLIRNSRTEVIDGEICLIVTDKRIKQIAEKMKGGAE